MCFCNCTVVAPEEGSRTLIFQRHCSHISNDMSRSCSTYVVSTTAWVHSCVSVVCARALCVREHVGACLLRAREHVGACLLHACDACSSSLMSVEKIQGLSPTESDCKATALCANTRPVSMRDMCERCARASTWVFRMIISFPRKRSKTAPGADDNLKSCGVEPHLPHHAGTLFGICFYC